MSAAGDEARTRALHDIVALARRHRLSAIEISTALDESPSDVSAEAWSAKAEPESRARVIVMRVLGYLGGTFVFAGIAAFIALQWDTMNSAARVVITLGSGLAACVMAVLSSKDERFEKAVAPLFLIAGVLEPAGMLVAFNEFGSGGDARWAALTTAGVVGFQFAALFGVLHQSMLLFLAVFFGVLFWWTGFDLLGMDEAPMAMVLGGSLVLAAIGVDRTPHAAITPPWFLFGGIAFLYGLFDVVGDTPFEILFILAASGFVYLSAAIQSRTLLIVATGGILGYTAWFTGEHFADSIGWPLALVVFGLLMIGMSALAFRIDRRYIRGGGA